MKNILLIFVLLISISLYSLTYTVKQDGTGDYTQIQSAIDNANAGDTIRVYSGTYYEEINFNNKNLYLFSQYYYTQDEADIVSTIIKAPNETLNALTINGTQNNVSEILGFTIEFSNQGMYIFRPQNTADVLVKNCIFDANYYGIYYVNGNLAYLRVNNCKFFSHKIYSIYLYGYLNSEIMDSNFNYNSNGIYIYGTDPMTHVRTTASCDLKKTIFYNNSGECLSLNYGNAMVKQSEFYNNSTVFWEVLDDADIVDHLEIYNTNVYNNNLAFKTFHANHNPNGAPTLVMNNSIVWNNSQISNLPTSFPITYTDIEGGYTGSGNIDKDPNFCTNDNYKYYLEEPSPCIDAGDPNTTGGDVRIDMGCYESTTDIKPLQGAEHWNWISFPRLVRPNNNPNDNCTNNAPNLLSGMLPYLSNLTLKSGDNAFDLTYNNQNLWSNPNYTIISTKGYKLELEDTGDFIVPEDGTRLDPNFTIHLGPGVNWVGYWLPGSMAWDVALGEYKDRFTQIKAEDWTMTKTPMGWIGPSNASFTYGKGYIMYIDTNAYPNGFDFHWAYLGVGGNAFKKEKAENFTYEEKPDYEVIDIASIDGGEDIEEIGAFVNGVCVGASKVEGYPVQILAYTENTNKGDGTFYFEVVSSDKSKTKRNDISVYNPQNQTFEKGEIKVTGNGYHLIKLGSGDYQEHIVDAKLTLNNYPNPFNPITTISYSIPKEGKAKLQIFNLKGQLVKTLVDGVVKKGKYNAVWNGVDNNGKKVASGIYMYKLSTKDKTITKKMVMLK